MIAVVLGASGSVGKPLIAELVRSGAFSSIVMILRTPQPELVAAGATEVIVPEMTPAAVEAATRNAIHGEAVGLSVLGVGAGTAKLTIAEHRAIDVELNRGFARGLRAAGAKHLAIMTAAGANPAAKETGSGAAGMARYARVKGETEEAVKADGPPIVSVFRPGMIIGSRHTPWLLEKVLPVFGFLTPKNYRSITVEQIARAMVATSVELPEATATYHYPEMIALATP